MYRVQKYINCVIEANERARNYYMKITNKYSQHEQEQIINESTIFQWTQIWGSTCCGFGGIGGAAMTTADTIVVEFPWLKVACVYHNGRFAFSCEIGEDYYALINKRMMPGQDEVKRTPLKLIQMIN